MKYILVVLVICLVTSGIQAQQETNIPWAMFHTAQKSNINSSLQHKTIGALKWKFKTGGKIFSSPAIVNGLAFIGSEDGNLYAIDIKTGRQNWKFATGGAVHSSPAVYGNTVYFGSFDGYYYAVDIKTGLQKWKFKTSGEKWIGGIAYWGMKPADMQMNDLWDYFLSSPIVDVDDDGLTVYFGSSDSNLYAVHAKDGSLKWKFKTNGIIHSSPSLYKGTLYIGSWYTYFYAIDAGTGKEKWKFKTGEQVAMSGIMASATVEEGMVYFGARDAHLYALNADNGNPVWKYDAENAWILGSTIIKDGVVYVGTSDSYLLLAIDAKTGKEKFRFKTSGYVFGSPAIAGNTVFVGDFTGRMYAIDFLSPYKHWSEFSTDARKEHASTVLKNDTLDFMYAAKGEDLSFYTVNKRVMDDFYTLGPIVSSPSIKDEVIYFGSADGYVYALQVE